MRAHLLHYIDKGTGPEARGLRLMVEYFYATQLFRPAVEGKIPAISVFGSARTPREHPNFAEAKKLGRMLFERGFAVVTGAAQGIMHAANEGVSEAILAHLKAAHPKWTDEQALESKAYRRLLQAYSFGLKITLPFEPATNEFVGSHASFHYFAIRKFFFAALSKGFIALEGGWGTRDELFEMLTLIQTGKAPVQPVVCIVTRDHPLVNDVNHLVAHKLISPEDRNLIDFVPDANTACARVVRFHSNLKSIKYIRNSGVRMALKHHLRPEQEEALRAHFAVHAAHYSRVEVKGRTVFISRRGHGSFGPIRQAVDIVGWEEGAGPEAG